ncbi:hypothetical protein ACROYT_G005099 [Oculina patagonica]
MTLNVPLFKFVWLLCGLLAVIQPALSIKCYRQLCDGTDCYGRDETVECESDADRCAIMTYKTDYDTNNVNRNCARSSTDCDQSPCDHLGTVMAEWDLSFSDCHNTCCEGDGCNAPSNDEAKFFKNHHHVAGNKVKSRKAKLAKLLSSHI